MVRTVRLGRLARIRASFKARPSLRSGSPQGVRCGRRSRPFALERRSSKEKVLATQVLAWGGFLVVVLVLLAVDLGVFNRKAHVIRAREAARWSFITMVLAGIFAGLIYTHNLPTDIVGGPKAALDFI